MVLVEDEKEWRIPEVEDASVLTAEDYLRLEPMVDRVAGYEWKRSVSFEMDDVAQAIWLHLIDKWEQYDGKDEELQFFQMRRFARTWCKQQRIEYMYATGAYVYTPKEIRARLDDSVFCEPENAIDVDARVDILREYERLTTKRRAVLYKKYALGEPLTTGAERTAASEATTIICDTLNVLSPALLVPLPEGYLI